MSHPKMLLPFILTLYLWDLYWMRLVLGSACPKACTCRWKGGKDTVECTGRVLSEIPSGIDLGTQVLNISDNNLQSLSKDTFLRAKLLNLQRIYMAQCNIGHIHEDAFNRLNNLVDLDLSGNQLTSVPTATFKDITELRRLYLNKNRIQRIDNNAFANLHSLGTLELSECELEAIAPKAFHGLKKLAYLKLDANRLTTLSGKSIQPLKSLHGVELHGNPWKCDCSMQDVKLWLTRNNIPHKLPPTCSQPPRLEGLTLDELQLDDLACRPQSAYAHRHAEVTVGHNASLVCEVSANPSPTVKWFRHGHPVVNLTRFFQGKQMYVIYEKGGPEKVSVLVITSVTEQDAGEYACVAENKAGASTANFTLQVTFRDLEASGLSSGQIAGISLGLILVGVIVLLLICILLAKWRQSDQRDVKHPPLNQSQHKLMNSVNHVDYKDRSAKNRNSVRMSFSLPRLSRSNSTQRNYSDEASDSDRTLIENLTSPSKSSTCNLSTNKPDVVNVERNVPNHSRSKKDKENRKREKRQKEKRKERHKWNKDENVGGGSGNTPKDDSNKARSAVDNRCNSVAVPHSQSYTKKEDVNHLKLNVCADKKKIYDDDNRYGSYGNLKLSSSNEWNKVTNEMIENAGFARDHDEKARESYELIEKSWGRCAGHYCVVDHNDCGGECEKTPNAVSPSSTTTTTTTPPPQPPPPTALDDGGVVSDNNKSATNTLSKNSNARFRHYVPVLPPLPAQHYSQVRNSLIRPCKDLADDITDM